jgi:hypothetical protein
MKPRALLFWIVVSMLLWCVLLVPFVRAEQPPCVGDRHDDCLYQAPTTTTSTTLPDEPQACPDPPPCPSVVCDCTGTGSTTFVVVDRCPEAPNYRPCWVNHHGKTVCGAPKHAHRVFVPEPAGE